MTSERGRSAWWMIWTNLKRSLTRPVQKGRLVGSDDSGTKYFEIPPDPQHGKRHPVRWYETKVKDDFELPIPVEWEAWLRGRRNDPPSPEEILKNVLIQRMKQENALMKKLDEAKTRQEQESDVNVSNKTSYPTYEEYEVEPGKSPKKNRR